VDIPFYENADNTHCYQAVFRMLLKYYIPEKDFSWKELDKITAKIDGLWTWPMAGMIWLHDSGFEVRDIAVFDYSKFVERGDDYLVEFFGASVAKEQIDHSDIKQELRYAKQLINKGLSESRIPDLTELKKRLDEGFLLICNINSQTLNHKEGYVGHFVLLTGYNNAEFVMHDPGPPGLKSRKVAFTDFKRAWAYPNEYAQNYMAVKLSAKS
jgi:hypothetical protein